MASFCAVCADHPTEYLEDRSVSLTNPKHVLSRSPQRKKSQTPSVSNNANGQPTQVALLEDQVRRMQTQLDVLSDRDRRPSAVPSLSPSPQYPRANSAVGLERPASAATRPSAQENAFVAALRKEDSAPESGGSDLPGIGQPFHGRTLSPSRHPRSGSSSASERPDSRSQRRPLTHLIDFPSKQLTLPAAGASVRRMSQAQPHDTVCAACGNDLRMLASYVEMLRAGFFDLCEAVQSDLSTLRKEQDAKSQDLQSTIAYNVSTAVRKEQLYHTLLDERMTATTQKQQQEIRTSSSPAAAFTDGRKYVSIEDHNEVLLELRRLQVVVNELQKNQLEMQRDVWSAAQPRSSQSFAEAPSAVAQQVLVATEPRLEAMVRQQIAPLAEHVRTLTATHQNLVQTVVDERCKKWEENLRLHTGRVDTQVAELRSRLSSQSTEWRSAIQTICASLQVAVPPL